MSLEERSSKPDLYIIARIVKTLHEDGGTKRTKLASLCNVSYDRLQKYLDWMKDKGLISLHENGEVQLTPDGLETYDRLVEWILEYVRKLNFPRFE